MAKCKHNWRVALSGDKGYGFAGFWYCTKCRECKPIHKDSEIDDLVPEDE